MARSSFAGAANRAPGRASQAPRRAPQQRSTSQPRSVRPPVLHVHQPVGAVLWDKLLAQHHWAQRQVIVASPAGSPTGTSGKQGARSTRDSRQPQPLSLGSRARTSHTTGWPTLSGQEWQDRSRSVRSKGRSSHVPGDQQSWVRHRTGHRLRSPYASTRRPAATSARCARAEAPGSVQPAEAARASLRANHSGRASTPCLGGPGVVAGSTGHAEPEEQETRGREKASPTASLGCGLVLRPMVPSAAPSDTQSSRCSLAMAQRKARFGGARVALGQNLHDLAQIARPKGRGPNISRERGRGEGRNSAVRRCAGAGA